MIVCPNCKKEILVVPPETVRSFRFSNPSNATLGCGTFILIAIIVAIFSGGPDLSGKIGRLESEVQQLEEKIDHLTSLLTEEQNSDEN